MLMSATSLLDLSTLLRRLCWLPKATKESVEKPLTNNAKGSCLIAKFFGIRWFRLDSTYVVGQTITILPN